MAVDSIAGLTGTVTVAQIVAALKGTTADTLTVGNDSRVTNPVSVSVGTGIELGPTTGGTGFTPFVDFHTQGGVSGDYDARLFAYQDDSQPLGTNLRALCRTFQLVGTLKANRSTAGQGDNGAATAFIANDFPDVQPGVLGYIPGLSALTYSEIDSVCTYNSNRGRVPFFVATGCTFSVTPGGTARVIMPAGSPLTAGQMGQMFNGMQLLTNYVQPWTAWVDTWDPAGTWVQVIGGFGHLGGSTAPNQDPTGSPVAGGGPVQVAFAPITKIWGENTNVFVGVDAAGNSTAPFGAIKVSGYELGVFNETGQTHTWRGENDQPNGYSWGFDAVSLGKYRAGTAFVARGHFDVGFQARAGVTAGFLADGPGHYDPGSPGFLSTQSTGVAFAVAPGSPAAAKTYVVNADGSMYADKATVGKQLMVLGAWPAGTTTASATFKNTGLSIGWNLSNGGGEVNLLLGRQLGSGGLTIYSVNSSGSLDNPTPIPGPFSSAVTAWA